MNNKYEVDVISYSDIAWCNSNHSLLGMTIHLSDNSVIPYAYRVDGSEDNDGFICQIVKRDYLSGKFTDIQECPQWKLDLEIECLKSDIREKRDELLSETDHLVTADYPITDECRNNLRVYRQALRDIPEQEGFPENVIWPEKPEIVKLK